MIFGSTRDAAMLLHIGREFVKDVVEQEVLYYKLDLEDLQENVYGEATLKYYFTPIHINCLIWRGDQEWKMEEYGPDINRKTEFAFFKADLMRAEVRPEVGDILEWDKAYFEVDGVKENQMWLGKDQQYRIDENTWRFGHSVSCVVSTHYTRINKLNIKSYESGRVVTGPSRKDLYQ